METVFTHQRRRIAITALTLSLLACGGGGGGGSKPAPTPSSATVSLAASSTAITSVAAVSSETYHSSATTSTQPASSTAVAESSLSNATVSSVVASSYRAIDKSPDAVIFNAINDAEVNQPYVSNTVTIKGVDEPVAISITGGRYSKNGGAYTSEASTITNGDILKLEVISSAKKEDTKTATVTIGTLSASFSVKTELDREPPVATFSFPTPYTMATGETLNVRGTASDDIEIKSITLHLTDKKGEKAPEIVEAEHLDVDYQPDAPKFANWKATVPLYDESETEIIVVAEDINGNEIQLADGDKVVVRERTDYSVAFPDNQPVVGSRRKLMFDKGSNALFFGSDNNGDFNIYKLDIDTAVIDRLYQYMAVEEDGYYVFTGGSVKDGKLYVIVTANDQDRFTSLDVIDINSKTLAYSHKISPVNGLQHVSISKSSNYIITTNDVRSQFEWSIDAYQFDEKGNIDFNSKKNIIYLNNSEEIEINQAIHVPDIKKFIYLNSTERTVRYVDEESGLHGVLSSDEVGSGPLFNQDKFGLSRIDVELRNVLYDSNSKKIIVAESLTGRIFEINPKNGDRRIISTLRFPYISPGTGIRRKTISSYALYLDERRHVFYSAQNPTNSVLVVDPLTEAQVILSKDENLKY